jgi:hypothetical protein
MTHSEELDRRIRLSFPADEEPDYDGLTKSEYLRQIPKCKKCGFSRSIVGFTEPNTLDVICPNPNCSQFNLRQSITLYRRN